MTAYKIPFYAPNGIDLGNGGIQTLAYSNTSVQDYLSDLGANTISTTGNVDAGYLNGNIIIDVSNIKITGGTNGYFLQTDGLGNLTWTEVANGGGGNATPGGANTQIQFNDAGVFGGSANLTWDGGNLTVVGNASTGNLLIDNGSNIQISNVGYVANVDGSIGNAVTLLSTSNAQGCGAAVLSIGNAAASYLAWQPTDSVPYIWDPPVVNNIQVGEYGVLFTAYDGNASPYVYNTWLFEKNGNTVFDGNLKLNSGGKYSGDASNLSNVGLSNTTTFSISIGNQAFGAPSSPYANAIGIGTYAGGLSQGENSIGIGLYSGYSQQRSNAIAIGANSATQSQGNNAIAIGTYAGNTSQGGNCIAIGAYAGSNTQPANSIILNATGQLANASASGFFVAPVRNLTASNVAYYNPATREFTYGAITIAAAGSNSQLQFNNAGSLGASANLTWTGTTLSVNGNIAVSGIDSASYLSATGNVAGGNVISSALVQGVTVSASGNVVSGNVNTTGRVSATGNVNGGNLISGALVQGVTVSASGNVIGGNVSTVGNVTGAFILGNGSQLTGITATSSYGNSNVVANLANLGSNPVSTTGNVTAGYFIGNGSQLTGLTVSTTYGNANVAANLANFGSNPVSTTGNVTAGYFIGNGSQLTGLPAGYSNTDVVANLANLGSNPVSTTGNVTAGYLNGNIVISTANLQITGGTNGYFLQTDGLGNLSWAAAGGGGNGSPGGANTQIQFNDAGIFGGSANLTWDGSNVSVIGNINTANLSASGNVNAAFLNGNIINSNANIKITGGTSGQFLQTDGTGNLSWATGGGGGGSPGGANTQIQFNNNGSFDGSANLIWDGSNVSVIGNVNATSLSGNITTSNANIKITGGANLQVLGTDGSGNLSWVNGLYTGLITTPPVLSNWTQINIASPATVSNSNVGLVITDTFGTGPRMRALTIAAPATPYTATALIACNMPWANFSGAGLLFSDGTKIQTIFTGYNSGPQVRVANFNSPTSFSADATNAQFWFFNPTSVWLQISDDGTNVIFRQSADGVNWNVRYQVAKASGFLGASGYTRIGFQLDVEGTAQTGTTQNCSATLMSWKIT